MKASDFAELMAQRRQALAKAKWGDEIQNPDMAHYYQNLNYRDAAVLIPIIDRPGGAAVLFTYRAAHLKAHAGQISFPGGKIDADDESATSAALREFHEEVGISSEHVRVIGQGPDYRTGSGYRIHPIIGIVPPDLSMVLDPGEVDRTFEVPLAHLLDPAASELTTKENLVRGHTVNIYRVAWGEHMIWGITAGIVASLQKTLLGAELRESAAHNG
ncbi:MAG: CoA pyrophosphatase [Pseudomonadota bacterium]